MSLDELSSSGGFASTNLVGRAIKYARCTVLSPWQREKEGMESSLCLVIHAYWFVAGVIDSRIKMT